MAPRLSSSGSAWVQPAAELPKQFIKLSATDNLCAHVYPTALWCFPDNENTKDPLFHYDMVLKGLARMLYQQPVMAGFLCQDERGAFNVEIPAAPDAGARLFYTDNSNDPTFPTFQQFADANYPIMDGKVDGLGKLHPPHYPSSSHGDPVFVGQFNRLKGGFILFACFSHLVGDLAQPLASATSWAANTKELTEAAIDGDSEPALPWQVPDILYDRSRLSPKSPGPITFDDVRKIFQDQMNGEVVLVDSSDPEAAAQLFTKTFPPAVLFKEHENDEDYYRTPNAGTWHFSKEAVTEIHRIAQAQAKQKLTSSSALTAFIWQRFFLAKYALGLHARAGEKSEDIKTSALVFPGDVRPRLNPPLPAAYLGAAVDMFRASVPTEELVPRGDDEQALGRGLAAAADAMRISNENWSEEKYMLFLTLSQQTPTAPRFLPKAPVDLLVTDHSRNTAMAYPDWGPGLGVPIAERQPYYFREIPAGEVTVLPRSLNKDQPVMIAGEQIILDRLLNDPLLKHYSKCLFVAHDFPKRVAKQNTTGNARL